MRELKIIDYKKYLEYINNSLSMCILGLDGDSYPLSESAKKRTFKNYYYCGSTIGLITELSLTKGNLFDFWHSLFENVKAKKNIYSDKDYLNNFMKLSEKESIRSKLEKLIYGPRFNTGEILQRAFKELNINLVSSLSESNRELSSRIAIKLLSQLYQKDCGRDLNLSRKKDFYIVHGDRSCKSFKKDFKVQNIENYHIFKEAVKSYDMARISCSSKKFVSLFSVSKDKLEVPCDQISGPHNFFEILKI
jgi:hypothetical protein